MQDLPPISREARYELTVGQLEGIAVGGEVPVFATPAMILMMELAAKELLRPYLEPGEDSVGVSVEVKHLAPTPLGEVAWAVAKLVSVEKRQFDFEVTAYDRGGEIGRGRHRRALVKLEKFRKAMDERRRGDIGPVAALPAQPGGERLRWATGEAIGTLTLDRVQKLNAVDAVMTAELEGALDYLEHPACPAKVIVLRGAGKHFCAGEDVAEHARVGAAESVRLAGRRGVICARLGALRQPLVAVVQGTCVGGGLALALACDWVLATHGASLGMPEIKLGWPPPYATRMLAGRVGAVAAAQLCLRGQMVGAAEAQRMGLVDEVLAPAQLDGAVARLTQELGRLPSNAVARVKELMAPMRHDPQGEALRASLRAYGEARGERNAEIGLRAFLAREAPKFE